MVVSRNSQSMVFCISVGIIVLIHVFTWFSQVDVFSNLLSGRLVREQVGPVMFSAVQNQVTFFS